MLIPDHRPANINLSAIAAQPAVHRMLFILKQTGLLYIILFFIGV